jgi:FG-GAP-like repeat
MKRESLALAVLCLIFVALSFPVQAQVSFFQPPTYSGSGNVFVADFNGDGKPDILTSDGTMNLGNGDGTFKLGTSLSSTSVPVLAVADFNGDGKPDVLEQGTGALLVLLGNGNGTFQAPISTASGASLSIVAATDLNKDGKADVVGVFGSSLLIYISKGDGTFAPASSYNLGSSQPIPPVLSFGDFNGDGKADVAVSTGYFGPGQEIVFLGNGDGTFQATPKVSAGVVPEFAAVGDFNGDGKLDLALTPGNLSPCLSYCDISVLLGNGDGTFQAPAVASAAPGGAGSLGGLAAIDLNGDGKLDLVVNGYAAFVYLGNGDGTFSNGDNYILSLAFGENLLLNLAVGDFIENGKVDVVGDNAVLLGNGDGTFQGIPLALSTLGAPDSVTGDFENDGSLDVATAGSANGSSGNVVEIFHNNRSGVLSLIHNYPLQQEPVAMVTADFNGDGKLDLVVFETGPGDGQWGYDVLLGNGDGSFQAPVFYSPGATPGLNPGTWIVTADFNKDHKPDIAITFTGSEATTQNSLAVFLGNGDGTFAAPVFYFDDGFSSSLMVADFNGDGNLDLASGGEDTTIGILETAILFGKGDGTFQAATFPTSLKGFLAQFTADLNNDGKADLISALQIAPKPSQVALGNGDGTFTVLPPLQYPVSAIGDFNGDGKLDVVVNSNAPPSPEQTGVLLGNGDGTFGSFINIISNGYTSQTPHVADMNGDGRPDLVFGAGVAGGIAVLLNTTPAASADFTISAASGSPTSKTISAGQTASFSLVVVPSGSFTGTVNLSCAVTPTGASAPTCSLSSSSLQIGSSGTQPVTVKVATTAGTAGSTINFPSGAQPLTWSLMLLGATWLWARNRKRLPVLGVPAILLALAFCASCGGGSSSSSQGTTYTATITANSGSVNHNIALQVVVQ